MKKLILLFTIVCAGQLYGMEAKQKMGALGTLPRDIRNEIVNTALATSNNLDEAISMIQKLSTLYNVRYDNLNDFKRLVHLLADKFGMSTLEIASKFDTKTAKEYSTLGNLLMQSIIFSESDKITELISRGADVNLSEKKFLLGEDGYYRSLETPLSWAKGIKYMPCEELAHKKTIEILIKAGAK